VSQLEDYRGSVVVSCCCYKLVAKAGNNSGTQRKENVRRWKALTSNGSENETVDTSVCVRACVRVCVIVNCKVWSGTV
jgi:hypothetical protein